MAHHQSVRHKLESTPRPATCEIGFSTGRERTYRGNVNFTICAKYVQNRFLKALSRVAVVSKTQKNSASGEDDLSIKTRSICIRDWKKYTTDTGYHIPTVYYRPHTGFPSIRITGYPGEGGHSIHQPARLRYTNRHTTPYAYLSPHPGGDYF